MPGPGTVGVVAPGAAAPMARAPMATAPDPAQAGAIRSAARDFEAMALGQLLQPMFATVDTSAGLFGGGTGEATWKPLLVDEMGKMLAKTGGIGIADAVFKEMLRMQEKANE